jgi:hypothetical protein
VNNLPLLKLLNRLKDIHNSLFCKIHPVMSVSLLRIGEVKLLQPQECLYKYGAPSNEFYIVLWGELFLKNISTKKKIYLLPGDTLSEEILYDHND